EVDPERLELGSVRVEAARERVVVHLAVALDVLLYLERRDRPALRHQERDQRKLPDQFFRVFCHREGPRLQAQGGSKHSCPSRAGSERSWRCCRGAGSARSSPPPNVGSTSCPPTRRCPAVPP